MNPTASRTPESIEAAFIRSHGGDASQVLFTLVQDRFFAGGLNPFDSEALAEAVATLGLSVERARAVLAGDEYAEAVRADVAEGRALGVTGVPFVVFDRRLAAAGAQSVAAYREVLDVIAKE